MMILNSNIKYLRRSFDHTIFLSLYSYLKSHKYLMLSIQIYLYYVLKVKLYLNCIWLSYFTDFY